MEASVETLGYSSKKYRDWFDEINAIIRDLSKAKNEARAALIRSPHNVTLRDRSKTLRNHAQSELRCIENTWWVERAKDIQNYVDMHDSQKLFDAIKTINGSRASSITHG